MNQKTIIASDPDERAVVALKGVGVAESRFRFDELVLDWRGPGKLEPFNVVFDLRGLPESLRTSTVDAAAFVATATVESAVKGERPGSVGEAETFETTATVATLQKLFRTFAEVFADAETVSGAKDAKEAVEARERERASEAREEGGAR